MHSNTLESLEVALWLYEIRLLHSDQPKCITEMMQYGNYDVLHQMDYCTDLNDYRTKVLSYINKLSIPTMEYHVHQKNRGSVTRSDTSNLIPILSRSDVEIATRVISQISMAKGVEIENKYKDRELLSSNPSPNKRKFDDADSELLSMEESQIASEALQKLACAAASPLQSES